MNIDLDMYQMTAVAVVVYYVGLRLKRRFNIFDQYCIPAPVIGGVLFSLLNLVMTTGGFWHLTLDTSLQGFFMTMFFTSIGYTASLRMLKEGGLSVLKLVAVCAVLIVLQNLVGIGLASVFNLRPLIGMATGSIPMVGGHGTAGSFGPLLEQMGAQGAATVAIAAATFGLVMGSVIGGPIARYLIDKDNLFCFECVQEPVHKTPVVGKEAYAVDKEYFLFGIGQLLVAMGIGSWITGLITSFGVTFPSYIGAMLAAAVIRNLSDLTGRYEVFSKEIDVMGSVSLSIFLSMALMGLKLWQLSELALPLVVMLLAQTAMMALFARFVIFNLMGRDYEAAVITAAGCGFGMGATPNAMANMNAIVARYGPAPKAYFIVPLVGSLFIDFINAFIITLFLNMF